MSHRLVLFTLCTLLFALCVSHFTNAQTTLGSSSDRFNLANLGQNFVSVKSRSMLSMSDKKKVKYIAAPRSIKSPSALMMMTDRSSLPLKHWPVLAMKDDDKLRVKRVQLALEDTDSYSATVAAFSRKVAGLGRRRGFPLAAMSDVRHRHPFGRRLGDHHRRGRHARQHQ